MTIADVLPPIASMCQGMPGKPDPSRDLCRPLGSLHLVTTHLWI